MIEILFIIGWLACGIATYGMLVAHYQLSFPSIADEHKGDDRLFGLFGLICGPFGLLACLFTGQYKKGWML